MTVAEREQEMIRQFVHDPDVGIRTVREPRGNQRVAAGEIEQPVSEILDPGSDQFADLLL